MPGIGQTLRTARRQQSRSIADAAAETRVRESYLAALEDEDFAALGGDVYVKGFIRLYARFLGVDGEALVAEFREHHQRGEELLVGAHGEDPQLSLSERGVPRSRALAYGGGALLALLVVLYILGGSGEQAPDFAPDPAASASAGQPTDPVGTMPLDEQPPVVTEAPVATAPPAAPTATGEPLGTLEIVVAVTGPSVRITAAGGQLPLDAELEQGDERLITSDGTVELGISDATAVTITVNGQPLSLAPSTGAVTVTCAVGQTGCTVVDR